MDNKDKKYKKNISERIGNDTGGNKRDDGENLTIYDIAKAAGVSPGTVSRTLNHVGYIKDETRSRIEKVVREMKFTPNRAARTLKTKKTGLIFLAIPDTDNPFYIDLIKAVQNVAKFNAYSLVLYYTDGKVQDEIKALKMMHENFADGMILVTFHFDQEHLKEIGRINSPLVISGVSAAQLGGRENDRYDYVGVDTGKGMYAATKHLISQGHANIAYIGGVKDLEVFRERYSGYCNALIENGIKIKEDYIFWGNYSESSGYEAGKYFMGMKERPSAVCAANDLLALGAMSAFEDEGLRMPKDMAVVGMDNIDIGFRVKPRLSSVSIAQYEIGRTAAELLMDRLNGNGKRLSRRIIFEPRLVVRESSVLIKE